MKIVEATLIIPFTILIIFSLIGLTMSFHISLDNQISIHEEYMKESFSTDEVQHVRSYEAMF